MLTGPANRPAPRILLFDVASSVVTHKRGRVKLYER